MAVILGLHGNPEASHDAAAAVVADGKVVAAVEEERLRRIKRAVGCGPVQAAREVLAIAGIEIGDVDEIAYPWQPSLIGDDVDRQEVETMIRSWLGPAKRLLPVQFVPHHRAHAFAALAFCPSEALGRDATVLVVDGSGECSAGAAYRWDGSSELRLLWHVPFNASLGIYYEALTVWLGFRPGEEGKTMGLAAYGRREMRRSMPQLQQPDRTDAIAPSHHSRAARIDAYKRAHDDAVRSFTEAGPPPVTFVDRADAAAAGQAVIVEQLLSYLDRPHGEAVALAGGVALNCSANGTLAAALAADGRPLYIAPPAGDSGVALGAAVCRAVELGDRLEPATGPYLGRAHDLGAIADALRDRGYTFRPADAEEVARGMVEQDWVCGWFSGAAEVGPRALGARSILARPDSPRVRDRVNLLKGRESWRPLAPSMTDREFGRSMTGAPSAHMLVAATANPDAHNRLAGVIHVDGSARPQVVRGDGPYARLIREVGKRTDTEAVMCTSFNQAAEPIVYSPVDAARSARTMGLDVLAGDGWLALPNGSNARSAAR